MQQSSKIEHVLAEQLARASKGEVTGITEQEIKDKINRQQGDTDLDLQKPPELHPKKKRYRFSDSGNGERFADQHKGAVLYCHPQKKWYYYPGTHWQIDNTGYLKMLAKQTARSIWDEISSISGEKNRKEAAKWAGQSESEYRKKTMLASAQSEPDIPILPEQLDAHPWYFNAQNITFDLKNWRTIPHSKSHLITKLAPVIFDRDATWEPWEKFLYEIMDGSQEKVGFLRKAVGYSLSADTSEQCIFIFIGTGANGKSTLLNVLRRVLGDYAMQTPFSTFQARNMDSVRNDIARMKAARFVCAIETNDRVRMDEALIKQLTGGDRVTARYLYQEYFEYDPEFKIFLAANYKPTIYGQDLAIWRRIKMVPFTVQIPEAEQDKNLAEKLLKGSSGVLNWALKGCREWQENGLTPPEEVIQATAEYKTEMDILKEFSEDFCILGDEFSTPQKDLWKAYNEWRIEAGETIKIGRNTFYRNLEAKGHLIKMRDGVKTVKGIGLKAEIVG